MAVGLYNRLQLRACPRDEVPVESRRVLWKSTVEPIHSCGFAQRNAPNDKFSPWGKGRSEVWPLATSSIGGGHSLHELSLPVMEPRRIGDLSIVPTSATLSPDSKFLFYATKSGILHRRCRRKSLSEAFTMVVYWSWQSNRGSWSRRTRATHFILPHLIYRHALFFRYLSNHYRANNSR